MVPSLKPLPLIGGVIAALLLLALGPPEGLSREGWTVAAMVLLMAVWWVSEAIPLPATSLVPLIVLPLSGIMPINDAAAPYANRVVVLLAGGFIIATAIERWGLHKRIALGIVVRAGQGAPRLIAGFMVASALLSMWISNTATTIMLTPIAASVALALADDDATGKVVSIPLLLAIAWGASIGGLATPVGTPTNLIVIAYLEDSVGRSISFAQWMLVGLPVVAVMLPAAWFILTKTSRLPGGQGGAGQAAVREALNALGPITVPERRVLIAFAAIASLWLFRGVLTKISIAGLAPFAGLTDHVIAVLGAVAMFMIPSGQGKGVALLDWPTAERLPWGVLLLFGGGLSMAGAVSATGLAAWLGGQMAGLSVFAPIVVTLALVAFVIFVTELTSNVATASTLLPVIGAMALASGADPVLLSVPVAMAASCAFMLPIATGPNAIVFARGEALTIRVMASRGLALNLAGIVLITLVVTALTPLVLG